MTGVTRDPLDAWLRDVVTRAGFAGVEDFAATFELKPYRLRQLYRAANKELLGSVDEVTTWPAELRAAARERGIAFSAIEPIVVQRSEGRTDDQRALSSARRQRGRGGAHGAPRRANDAVHIVAGWLCVRLCVLRHRSGWF